jgi:hypothetical protein
MNTPKGLSKSKVNLCKSVKLLQPLAKLGTLDKNQCHFTDELIILVPTKKEETDL